VTEIIRKVNDKEVPNYPDIVGKPKILGTISLPNGKLVIQVNITTKNGSQYEVSHNFLAFYLAEINRAGIELPSSPTLVFRTGSFMIFEYYFICKNGCGNHCHIRF